MNPLSRLFAATLALAVIAACGSTGTNSSGGGDDDDDDGGGGNTDACTLVWTSVDATDASTRDIFLLDAAKARWVDGTVSYDVSTMIGVLYNEAPIPDSHVPEPVAVSAAITTAGTFELELASGLDVGGTVSFNDVAGQVFLDQDLETGVVGGVVGTGFAMSFVGQWSSTDPDDPLTPGTGVVSIQYLSSSLEIGAAGSYAVCYSSVAQSGTQMRLQRAFDRVVRGLSRSERARGRR